MRETRASGRCTSASEYERPHALEIASLHAGYGRYHVVRDLDFLVGEGEAVALLGPNGAGKTTVLRSIMGLSSTAAARFA